MTAPVSNASSACTVTDAAGSPVNVTNGSVVRVQPGDLVTIALQNSVGVLNWRLRASMSDYTGIQSGQVLAYQTTGFSMQIVAPNEPSTLVLSSQADDRTGVPPPVQFTIIVGKPNEWSEPQASTGSNVPEQVLVHLLGSGTLFAAYFVPFANSAPAAGSNSQALTLNIYNAAGALVGTVASATLNNANQMTKAVRFNLGTISNANWQDGYTVTYQSTATGTATLPAGQWVLVGMAN